MVMTIVIVLVAIALGGAIIARLMWRQGTGERHSVRDHQHALETLRHVSGYTDERSVPGGDARPRGAAAGGAATPAKVRDRHEVRRAVTGPASDGGADAATRRRRPVPGPRPRAAAGPALTDTGQGAVDTGRGAADTGRGAADTGRSAADTGRDAADAHPRRSSPARPMFVFDDRAVAPVAAAEGGPALSGYRERTRPWLLVSAMAAAVAVVVIVAVVVMGGPSSRGPHRPATATHRHRPTVTTPSVTVPAVVQPASFTAAAATYRPAAANYIVVVTAQAGECWIMATNPDTGAVMWEGLLAQGSSQTLPASGPMEVELGAASAAKLTLDGVPVALPPGFHSPFNATFTTT